MTGRAPCSLAERFWEKVSKSDGCWEWTASKSKRGKYRNCPVGCQCGRHRRIA